MLVPYALGYALARPGTEFTGIIMNPEDSQSYFAKMLQGYDGNWLYTIPFTAEEHAPAFVGGFYLALGHLARWLGLSLDIMWHLARVVADAILFIVTFGFIATLLRDPCARWTAFMLAIFGSGLGWVLFLLNEPYWLGAFPVDFKMPEAHLFFSALTFPHVALGTALILVSLWCMLPTADRRPLTVDCGPQTGGSYREWLYAVGAGLANLVLAIVYPFLIYLVVATISIYWLMRVVYARRLLWQEVVRLLIAFAIPAPLILYYAGTLATNPTFRAWEAQSITLSPPLPHYILAYGVMLLLAALLLFRKRAGFALLWAWVLAAALLVYAPLNSQRRFVEGVHVPLAILAAGGLFEVVFPWLERTRAFQWLAMRPRYSIAGLQRFFVVVFLAGMSLSNLYIIASVSVTAALQQPYPLFRPRDEIAAVDWLRTNTTRSAVVLGEYETGNYIPARAGNRVVLGHWAETADWQTKFDETERFYGAATDDAWRSAFLARYRVMYVWYGARERALGAFNPERVDYLQRVFENDTVRVYRVCNP